MANQTVYPYGTGGSLPSSVGIINDLITGGADKALSAEQGKVLAAMINENDGGIEVVEDGIFFVDNYFRIGAKITSSGLDAINLLTFETL